MIWRLGALRENCHGVCSYTGGWPVPWGRETLDFEPH